MSSQVAITGIHGFLGSAIAQRLRTSRSVTSLGRHAGDVRWSLEDTHAPPLAGHGAIIHCAWIVAPRTPATATTNIGGSLALLDEARRLDIPFVFVSSMSASDTTGSRYGRSKREVERYVLDYDKGFVLRPGTIQDDSGGMGMLGESLTRIAGLPIRVDLAPNPMVPIVSLSRVVHEVDHLLQDDAPTRDNPTILVDSWQPLTALIDSLTATPRKPARAIRIPSGAITAACSFTRHLPPVRDLSDSWLGLADASANRPTTSP